VGRWSESNLNGKMTNRREDELRETHIGNLDGEESGEEGVGMLGRPETTAADEKKKSARAEKKKSPWANSTWALRQGE